MSGENLTLNALLEENFYLFVINCYYIGIYGGLFTWPITI